jgi:hypothetical protein
MGELYPIRTIGTSGTAYRLVTLLVRGWRGLCWRRWETSGVVVRGRVPWRGVDRPDGRALGVGHRGSVGSSVLTKGFDERSHRDGRRAEHDRAYCRRRNRYCGRQRQVHREAANHFASLRSAREQDDFAHPNGPSRVSGRRSMTQARSQARNRRPRIDRRPRGTPRGRNPFHCDSGTQRRSRALPDACLDRMRLDSTAAASASAGSSGKSS